MVVERVRALTAVTLLLAVVAALPLANAGDADRTIEHREQWDRDGFDALSYLCVLQTPVIRTELKLTAVQDAEIKRLRAEVDEIIHGLVKLYSESAAAWREAPIEDRITFKSAPYRQRILTVLTSVQRARWEQIVRQIEWEYRLIAGEMPLDPPMSQLQKNQFASCTAEFERASKVPDELAEPRPTTPERERQQADYEKKHDAARASFLTKCNQLLTPEQRQGLNKLHGQPFDLEKLGEQCQHVAIRVSVQSPPGVEPPVSRFMLWQ